MNTHKTMNETKDISFWGRHIDKIGIAGSLFAALCCLGFPALISIITAVGLGLLITLVGLYLGIRHHRSWLAFGVGAISAIVIFIAVAVVSNKLLAIIGIGGLIVASFVNVWLRMSRRSF
ncbi:MAG: hypothetical protein DME33_09385 [Verrucomicrobia bacterium]|nr:MAG: hypothetical protein DME33_09385 [Verrucomicrobiota bacterium]